MFFKKLNAKLEKIELNQIRILRLLQCLPKSIQDDIANKVDYTAPLFADLSAIIKRLSSVEQELVLARGGQA